MKTNYKRLEEYKLIALTGNYEMELNRSTININQILTNIPINIFIPKEKEGVKNFLVDQYPNLKEKFNTHL
mgnify:CR=1 FL=1